MLERMKLQLAGHHADEFILHLGVALRDGQSALQERIRKSRTRKWKEQTCLQCGLSSNAANALDISVS